jgi:MFS family permease
VSRKPTAQSSTMPQMAKGAFAIVFTVQFVTAMGNNGMQAILPAIGREIGIKDYLIAGIFSLSALLWAIGSPLWAKQADKRGRKPLIILGMGGFAVSMLGCAAVVTVGLHHLALPMVVFAGFLLARAIFGLLGSAAPPASQAYLAERTGREGRTAAIAALAGAFGLGTVIGPAVAPFFKIPDSWPAPLAYVGQAGPMVAFAVIALGVMVWVMKGLPETWPLPEAAEPQTEFPSHAPAKAQPLWKDKRVQPFLIYGLLVSACQTAQYQTLGFLIIDKVGVPPLQAQGYITLAMMAGAGAGLFAQWGLIKIFNMSPRQLLRWGALAAGIANLMTAFAPSYGLVVAGFALSSLGYGLARPGYSAGASLAVGGADQARAAGAVAAVNGLNTVAAPLFVLLYEAYGPAPYVTNAVILVAMLFYAFRNGALSGTGTDAAPTEPGAEASLDRNSGASGF